MLIEKEDIITIFKEADPDWLEEALELLDKVPESDLSRITLSLP